MANLGFPRSKSQILEAVKLYLDKTNMKIGAFTDNQPGISWFYGFLHRYPNIKMKKAEKLEQARAVACTKESVYSWFYEFEKFLEENNIKSKDQIYNCDEYDFPLQAGSSMKVLCHKHSHRNFQITSNTKTSITTLHCIFANIIPPCVPFPGVKFNLEYSIGFPKNFYLGFTKNGWMDMKQFYGWIMNHFLKKIPLLHPVVLLVDGHGSHIDYYGSKFCLKNGILSFRLPPHTSHAIQPTDEDF